MSLREIVNRFSKRTNRTYAPNATEGYSPEALVQLLREHVGGRIEFQGQMPARTLLTDSAKVHSRKFESFAEIKTPPLVEKINAANTPAATALKTQITAALAVTNDFKEKRELFARQMDVIKELMADENVTFLPSSAMQIALAEGEQALKSQHQAETDKLNDLFESTEFCNNLKQTLGADTDTESVKSEMQKTLEEAQKKERESFKKEMTDSITKMHQAEATRTKEIALIAKFGKDNQETRALIDAALRKKQEAASNEVGIGLHYGSAGLVAKFSGLKMSDFQQFKTKSGQTVEIAEDGSMSIKLPGHWTGYYVDEGDNLKNDLLAIAEAIRKDPKNTHIKWTIDINDTEFGLEAARKAYEASVEAGYKEEEISFTIRQVDEHGKEEMKEIKAKDLFSSCPERKQQAEKKGKENAEGWNTALEGLKQDSTRLFKQRFSQERAASTTPAAAPQQQQHQGPGPIAVH